MMEKIVLNIYPSAYSFSWSDCWCIYSGGYPNEHIGTGSTEELAWKDAAEKLSEGGAA